MKLGIPLFATICGIAIATVLIFAYWVPKDFFHSLWDPVGDLRVSPSPCVCAFDLDHTLTCGDPRPLVAECKAKGCRLAINTARPTKYADDIPLSEYGFVKPDYDDRDFYYNTRSYLQTPQEVAEVKSGYLELLRNKYSVRNKSCIVLFDDSQWNLEAAKSHGFATIAASQGGHCGLQGTEPLRDILRRCSH